ncbi:MAG: FAD-dependent oxidoreductase, partial [Acetobacteraceae bacterium]|nr:FAD-dependent oxidoreductase [Acetobacteraceae bacterium]
MALGRRAIVQGAGGIALAGLGPALSRAAARRLPRVRPGDPDWPSAEAWAGLRDAVGGRLLKVEPLFAACERDPHSQACAELLSGIRNPYYIGEQAAGTQTSGWVDAWMSAPSAYAVPAHSSADVVAAVNFARTHRVRLIIKGGGHSYLGGSNAPDSLLVWMRPMDRITVHDAFVGQDGAGAAVPAVSVETGARWLPVYNAVATTAGRYVQGGGCATVGVAGLVLGNGFGSFSKRYGCAAAGLLEAEVVTADGAVRIANDRTEPDLFWALKGGGCCSFGVVTRLTLRTHGLPEFFGGVLGAIRANSDEAFRRLIARFNAFYASSLCNPHWGEQVSVRTNNVLNLLLVFQDLTEAQARAVFKPFLSFVAASPSDYSTEEPIRIIAVPARHWWDPDYLAAELPSQITRDPRPGAPPGNIWWAG